MSHKPDFDRTAKQRIFDTEEWYHNSHGSFSHSSGRFQPKKDVNDEHAWHGNLDGEPKDRKGSK